MEDHYIVSNDGHFAAVFDGTLPSSNRNLILTLPTLTLSFHWTGHGGADVSSYVKNQFFACFLKALPEKRPWQNEEVEQAFGNAIRTVDDEVMR